jgi:hypothetical protein
LGWSRRSGQPLPFAAGSWFESLEISQHVVSCPAPGLSQDGLCWFSRSGLLRRVRFSVISVRFPYRLGHRRAKLRETQRNG